MLRVDLFASPKDLGHIEICGADNKVCVGSAMHCTSLLISSRTLEGIEVLLGKRSLYNTVKEIQETGTLFH